VGFQDQINVYRTIDKYKARLVARHFSQVQGVDYIKVFFAYGQTKLHNSVYCNSHTTQSINASTRCENNIFKWLLG
jgi:hypothetical protein